MNQNVIKFGRLLLAAACFGLLMCMGQSVMASNMTRNCGSEAVWTLENGVLTISGSGSIDDYSESSLAPWYRYKEEITEVVIQEGITEIGILAFYDCTSLIRIQIPDSVTKIENYAFMKCTSLIGVSGANNLSYIGTSAFESCKSLSVFKLPETLSYLGTRAFYRCSSLGSITVPVSVSTMGSSVFAYCENLVQAIIKPYLIELPSWTFYGCNSLVSVTLPTTIIEVGEYAFYECNSLKKAYTSGSDESQIALTDKIKQDVPDFEEVGDTDRVDDHEDSATWKPDIDTTGQNAVIQKDAIEAENAVVTGSITQTYSTGSNTEPEYDIIIDAVIKNEDGWDTVVDLIDKYVQKLPSLENSNNEQPTVYVNINLETTQTVPGHVLEKFAGKQVNLNIHTNGNSGYVISCDSIETEEKVKDYKLSFVLTKNIMPTTEHRQVIGDAESFFLKFSGSSDHEVVIIIPLGTKYAYQFATLLEKPLTENWSTVQSVQMDASGNAEFYLSDFDSITEYMIAINVHGVSSTDAIIPEGLYDEYGGLTDATGNKYVISGTNTLFNLSFWQFGLAVLGVIIGTIIIVGGIMLIVNKRKVVLERTEQYACTGEQKDEKPS